MEEPIQELAPRISDCLMLIFAMQERGQKVSTSAVSLQLPFTMSAVVLSSRRKDLMGALVDGRAT